MSHRCVPSLSIPQYSSQSVASLGKLRDTLSGNSIGSMVGSLSLPCINLLMSLADRLPSNIPLAAHEALKHCHLRIPISLDAPKVFLLWHVGQSVLTEWPIGSSISTTCCLMFMLPLLYYVVLLLGPKVCCSGI